METRKMTHEEFKNYRKESIGEYAAEHVRAGDWEEDGSLEKADKEFLSLLPEGIDTPGHHLYSICKDLQVIGMFWLAVREAGKGWVYDVKIREEHRGKGYGEKTMNEIEYLGKELGLQSIRLHVFGHNHIARELYKKIGYNETNVFMEKQLTEHM